ncbi:MAG: hypothetical protein WD942_04785 [Dehalococcoidia bacterium]
MTNAATYASAVAAVAAMVTAFATWRVARASGQSVDAAERAARAAELAADASERSVLLQAVPVIIGWKANVTGGGNTEVSILALGGGVGFNVTCEVQQNGASYGETPTISHLVGGSEHGPRDTRLPGATIDPNRPYETETRYSDAAGNQYRTLRRSNVGGIGELVAFDRLSRSSEEWEAVGGLGSGG